MKQLTGIIAILFFAVCIAPSFTPIENALAASSTSTTLVKEVIPAPPAVVASTITAAPTAPVPPTTFDKILEAIKNSGGIVAGLLVLFEIVVRIFPSKSPLSILVPVKYFVDSFATILLWLSNLLVSLINIANKSQVKLEKTELPLSEKKDA